MLLSFLRHRPATAQGRVRARLNRYRAHPVLEQLEDRVVPYALSGTSMALPGVHLMSVLAPGAYTASPLATSAPGGGYSPSQIRHAYGFDQISFNGVNGNGAGQTIAIIDAYDDPNIAADVAAFDSALGIAAPPTFNKVNQTGGTIFPAANSDWALETSLDVEWAHSIAPAAKIVLVEAKSNSYSDLFAAVDYARKLPGVSVISMSWGSTEFSSEGYYDSYLTTPSGHSGVTFVASSGDSGSSGAPEYPSVSPNVLAVGGTLLTLDAYGNYGSETGWSGSGGGISVDELQPSYQTGAVTQSATKRTVPDVAYDGSSSSPFGVYDTYGYGGWIEVYGTSAGAPQWAALIAIANQGRAAAGQSTLNGPAQTLPKLYKLPQSDFHDIVTGNNGGYSAKTGYDLVTGRGTPWANLIAPALIDAASTSSGPTVATRASATPNPVTGKTTNLSVLGADPAGELTLTYTWFVTSEPTGATAPTYSANGTNAAKDTIATFYLAGNYTFQVTIKDASGLSTTSSVGVTVNQTLTSIGVSPATCSIMESQSKQLTATTLDQFGKAMAMQPSSFTWSLAAGSIGTVSSTGLYQAPATSTGVATVLAGSNGRSGHATVTVTALITISAAPANLSATAYSRNQVTLSWSETSSNVTRYNIQRTSNGGKSWVRLAQVTTTSYVDKTVKVGKTYIYRVDAYNSAGYSAWTYSNSVITPHALLVGGSTPGTPVGSVSNQNAPAIPSDSNHGPSAAVLAYFLAAPANGSISADQGNDSQSELTEQALKYVARSAASTSGALPADQIPASNTLGASSAGDQNGEDNDLQDGDVFAWDQLVQL